MMIIKNRTTFEKKKIQDFLKFSQEENANHNEKQKQNTFFLLLPL